MLLPAPGCGPKRNAASQLTNAPTMESATGESKCSVRASAAKPLVVEWPAAERAALEARAQRGLVAVRYEGCDMEVLTNCTASGTYGYVGLNQKREGVRIKNADELYAELPVGAAGLEAKLKTAGQLNVDMVIIGRKEADKFEFNERDLDGRCDEATHVITGLTVGAFSFYTGASAAIGAGVKIGHVGVGAESSAEQEVLKQDGDEDACALAEQGADAPPSGCGALLRVEVVEIDKIFNNPKPVTAASSTPSGSGDTVDLSDPDAARKARTWNVIGISGYAVALGGLGALAAGLVLRTRATSKLKEEPSLAPGAERQKQIQNVRVGGGLLVGGASLAAVGFLVGVFGIAKAKKLKSGIASVSPVLGPGLAGANVEVHF